MWDAVTDMRVDRGAAAWQPWDMFCRAWLVLLLGASCLTGTGTTISVVPVFEPVTLRGSDVDEAVSETGEALQAAVVSRPMALSGAFPETLVDAIRTPHQLPTNDPNYVIDEVNLLVLCRVGIAAEIVDEVLKVELDVGGILIPEGIDLTERQVLKLAIVAVRKTLEAYQLPQQDRLKVRIVISRAAGERIALRELECEFEIKGG